MDRQTNERATTPCHHHPHPHPHPTPTPQQTSVNQCSSLCHKTQVFCVQKYVFVISGSSDKRTSNTPTPTPTPTPTLPLNKWSSLCHKTEVFVYRNFITNKQTSVSIPSLPPLDQIPHSQKDLNISRYGLCLFHVRSSDG